MLEIDYSQRLADLFTQTSWNIELPEGLGDFFLNNGEAAMSFPDDERTNQQIRIRTEALLWSEVALPFRPRESDPIGIYTQDFSRTGMGFLSSIEFYPEEEVRILVPSFWVQVRIARTRRLGKACYETGAILIRKHSPSVDAFNVPKGESPSIARDFDSSNE